MEKYVVRISKTSEIEVAAGSVAEAEMMAMERDADASLGFRMVVDVLPGFFHATDKAIPSNVFAAV